MLKFRILTSIILLPLTIWLIIASNNTFFIFLTTFVLLLAAHEWANLIGFTKIWQQLLFIILVLFSMLLSFFSSAITVFVIALCWWSLAFVWICLYPYGVYSWNKRFFLILLGIEVLMPCWLAIVKLRLNFGAAVLIYLLSLIWAADIGAFFTGRFFGKHKLAPKVSPGKTIEGVIGGVCCSVIVAIIGVYYFDLPNNIWWFWFLLAFMCALISVVGDLLESMMKRQSGVKDSGSLLPGHGGLLDRIDSLTAAAPLFALNLMLFKGSLQLGS